MSDDHAFQAMSCYGSQVNQTPNLDRIAREGMRFDGMPEHTELIAELIAELKKQLRALRV